VRKAERKVMDLETPPAEEGLLPESDNSVNNVEQEMYLKTVEEPVSTHTPEEIQFWSEPEPEPENHPTPIASKPTETENFFDEEKEEEEKPVFDFRYPEIKDETPSFTTLSLFPEEKTEEEKPHAEWNFDQEEEEEGLFAEDEESGLGSEEADDQVSHEQLTMGANLTRKRLEEQARKRREQLEGSKRNEMTKEEFNSKWSTPAYLRRGVQMENVPHSSQSHISRFNLNDDNTILGNNKFLHDNVD
jgi:cell division protein FtsZ